MNFIRRNHIIFTVFILGLGLIWIWINRQQSNISGFERMPLPRVGFPAPGFELPDEQGITLRLDDLKGQAVIINLWASWCPPCQAEMPALESVYRDYMDEGLVVVGINTTYQDDPVRALEFAASRGLTFPILLDYEGQVSASYQLQALPTTFFIDADGIITEIVVGGPISEALLRIRAENLLKEKAN